VADRTVVESGAVIVSGQQHQFDYQLLVDGAAYNLTAKTVRVTVKRYAQYNTYNVHSNLNNVLITVLTPSTGQTRFVLTAALSALLPGGPRVGGESYVIEYKVPEDDWIGNDLIKFDVVSRLSP
jgi:hypothetical protein